MTARPAFAAHGAIYLNADADVKTFPICGMQVGAPCLSALPAPKTTRGISQEEAWQSDFPAVRP